MQMCPWCDTVYDESEYSKCPKCHPDCDVEKTHIVIGDDGTAIELTDAEFEEFKKTHKGYI